MNSISAIKLHEKLILPHHDLQLVDVREPWEYETAQIPESVNIPLGSFAERVSEVERSKSIVVICHHGQRSAMACEYLLQNGYEKVFNLTGGIDAWSENVDPKVPRY